MLSHVSYFYTVKQWTIEYPHLNPMLHSLYQFFYPFLKTQFNQRVQEKLVELLTVDLFADTVDLITDAFIQMHMSHEMESDAPNSTATTCDAMNSKHSHIFLYIFSLLRKFVINESKIIQDFEKNPDTILLFFVDLLDILVQEVSNA